MTQTSSATIRVLFYRYGSICEPDVIDCFRQAGLTVVEDQTQITEKKNNRFTNGGGSIQTAVRGAVSVRVHHQFLSGGLRGLPDPRHPLRLLDGGQSGHGTVFPFSEK